MRILRPLLLCGALGVSACPERQAPPAPAPTKAPDYQRASEAVKARIPTGGLPTDPAVKNIQRGLEEAERNQDRRKDEVEKAAAAE